MKKYVRKGRTIEPLVAPFRVAWLDDDVLVVVDRATFDREYERVEEKGGEERRYVCIDCGRAVPPGERFCIRCWKTAEFRPKKPKPFTYEKHSYGFHAHYICARCGKGIDELKAFMVSGSPCSCGDGQDREAICMDCWAGVD